MSERFPDIWGYGSDVSEITRVEIADFLALWAKFKAGRYDPKPHDWYGVRFNHAGKAETFHAVRYMFELPSGRTLFMEPEWHGDGI